MKVTTQSPSETEAILTIVAEDNELKTVKEHVLKHLAKNVKIPGFREGKAPANLVEKNVDPAALQTEFLEHAINDLYPLAIKQTGIRPVAQPQVELKKYVPFSTLEFDVKVAVIGEVKLGDYKRLQVTRPEVKVTAKDVDEVITALRKRSAVKKPVEQASKSGDEVIIDFKGVNDEGEDVKGAEGKDYPLELGSNAFIPGFEDNLIGLKAGDSKTFKLRFPKDYSVKALANREVNFTVTVKSVNSLELPKLDDAFAASVGPVKTVEELKNDIKRELQTERQRQADLNYESELVRELTKKSKLTIPTVLIDDQVSHMLRDLQQNLIYRGQTLQEFLDGEGKTEEEYKNNVLAPQAEERVKASLVLAEVAEKEDLQIMPEELEIRMQALKSQYTDPKMQEELDKPQTRRDIASRMLSEKTVAKIAAYAQNK